MGETMSKRDIGQELLEGIRAIKGGQGQRVTIQIPGDVKEIRDRMDLSQSAFAGILGVSVRTVQEWEQGRRKPSGPAASLLRVAQRHPEALLA
ncbi:MAG: type II toxin-antitoxin system MqsA family antitoxin [Magnetococcales bacterium]|nr:type II toxin-antitoxin system MqsA family antitoxin [Magnetococcales bacterium]